MYEKLDRNTEKLATEIVDSCFIVHKELGPGLLENIYEVCLIEEFKYRNLECDCQREIPIIYKGMNTGKSLRIDLLVENEIILELKSVERIVPVYQAQLLTYLKLMNKRLGFLVNFNVPIIKQGIKRVILWKDYYMIQTWELKVY